MYYERSALQAGDIYTKAFPVSAGWDRACKLINNLEPRRFWGGRDVGDAGDSKDKMGAMHKGGVEFDYWVSNLGTDGHLSRGRKPRLTAVNHRPLR